MTVQVAQVLCPGRIGFRLFSLRLPKLHSVRRALDGFVVARLLFAPSSQIDYAGVHGTSMALP